MHVCALTAPCKASTTSFRTSDTQLAHAQLENNNNVPEYSAKGKMPSCHRCSTSVKDESLLATCPVCMTHFHNTVDCGRRIKEACLDMDPLEAAKQCPKCAQLCICAGGPVRRYPSPFCFDWPACLLAFSGERADTHTHKQTNKQTNTYAHFYTAIKTSGEVPCWRAAQTAPGKCL